MKPIDVSRTVMRKVAAFEQRRVNVWILRFFSVVLALGAGLLTVLFVILLRLKEQQTFDLFELFTQDPEIIGEFAGEVIAMFLAELPQQLLLTGVIMLGILLSAFLVTRNKRLIMKKKLSQLEKYS